MINTVERDTGEEDDTLNGLDDVSSSALNLEEAKPAREIQLSWSMVLKLDGNSEIGAHVRSNFCYLIRLMHLTRSRIGFFSPNLPIFLMRALHILSYHLI